MTRNQAVGCGVFIALLMVAFVIALVVLFNLIAGIHEAARRPI